MELPFPPILTIDVKMGTPSFTLVWREKEGQLLPWIPDSVSGQEHKKQGGIYKSRGFLCSHGVGSPFHALRRIMLVDEGEVILPLNKILMPLLPQVCLDLLLDVLYISICSMS